MTMSSNRQPSLNDPVSTPDLLIAGASARAAAFSARRGGLRIATADLFADADLAQIADAMRIPDWPNGLREWAKSFPREIPFLYAGGLENAPELLDEIAQERRVAGITGGPLRDIRNPQFLAEWCAQQRFRYPRLLTCGAAHSRELLVKPCRGTAGLGIRHFEGKPLKSDEYLQEFIAGRSISAAYLVNATRTELLGTFQQLPPEASDLIRLCPKTHTNPKRKRGRTHRDRPSLMHQPRIPSFRTKSNQSPFLYRGSITQAFSFQHRLNELGAALETLGIRGLCGVDFIDPGGGEPVILEINPRLTASMELLEQQSGRSLVSEHLASFGISIPRVSPRENSRVPAATHLGKRIAIASRSVTWRLPLSAIVPPLPGGASSIADVPQPGARIKAGEPICTLFATGDTFNSCHRKLLAREQRLLSHLEIADDSG